MRIMGQARVFPSGGCREALPLEDWHLHSRQPPGPPCMPVSLMRFRMREGARGRLTVECPLEFIPFDPFFSGGIYCSAAHLWLAKYPFMSTMSRVGPRLIPAEALAVDKEILLRTGWTPETGCSLDGRKNRSACKRRQFYQHN
jgi:hypothetical protein